jgi:hypothetical protein
VTTAIAAVPPILLLTEAQTFAAVRSFLVGAIRSSTFAASCTNGFMEVASVFAGNLYRYQQLVDPTGVILSGTHVTSWNYNDPKYSGQGNTGTYQIEPLQNFPLLYVYGAPKVVRGQVNRVAEPRPGDFIIVQQLRQPRIATNYTTYGDNIIVASIEGNVLTISAMTHAASSLLPGMLILDVGGPLANGTTLGLQLTGTPNGIGTYNVYPPQSVPQETMYIGVRSDIVLTQTALQLDFHGPNSADNTKIVQGLWRSEYSYDLLQPLGVAPLYASEPVEAPFINAEQQYEYRWTLDLEMQVNPTILTTQQFFDHVAIALIEADGEGSVAPVPVPPLPRQLVHAVD